MLDQALFHYCNSGVADSTRTYRSGLNRFLSFCFAFGVPSPFPVSETLLCYFVTALAWEGIAPATIRTYLAAVRHAQIMHGLPEPRGSSSLPRLRLVQSGVSRERANSGPASQERLPLTPPLLRLIWPPTLLSPQSATYEEHLLWAAASVCFFGFFRAGEITTAYDSAVHLSWGDVSISDDGRILRVFLKRSKTDQYGRGVEVFIGAMDNDLCPVRAVRIYMTLRGTQAGAFFCVVGGSPLTKCRFVELVRSALSRAGVPIAGYSGHSFRIGAATAAAQVGIPDSVIQVLGRWSSPAFLHYIRSPRSQLAQYSSPLAHRS